MKILGCEESLNFKSSGASRRIEQYLSGANQAQRWQTPVTTECDEMEIVASIVADEFIGHGTQEKSKPLPFKTEAVKKPQFAKVRLFTL